MDNDTLFISHVANSKLESKIKSIYQLVNIKGMEEVVFKIVLPSSLLSYSYSSLLTDSGLRVGL